MSKRGDGSLEDETWKAPRSFKKAGPELLEKVRKSGRISRKIVDSWDEGMSDDERTDLMEETTSVQELSLHGMEEVGDGVGGVRQRIVRPVATATGLAGPVAFQQTINPWGGHVSGSVEVDRATTAGHGDVLTHGADSGDVFEDQVTRTTAQLLNQDAGAGLIFGDRSYEDLNDTQPMVVGRTEADQLPLVNLLQSQQIPQDRRPQQVDDDVTYNLPTHNFRGHAQSFQEQIRVLEERAVMVERERILERNSAIVRARELAQELDAARGEANTVSETTLRKEESLRAAMDLTSRSNLKLMQTAQQDELERRKLAEALSGERMRAKELQQRVRMAENLTVRNKEHMAVLLTGALQPQPEASLMGGKKPTTVLKTTKRNNQKLRIDEYFYDSSSDDHDDGRKPPTPKVKQAKKEKVTAHAVTEREGTVNQISDEAKKSFRLPKVPEFNGDNFEGFMYKFDAQRTSLGWSDVTARFNLMQSLTGKAMSVLYSNQGEQWTYDELREALLTRYGINKSATTVMNEMSAARRLATESLQDFADRIVDMSLKAHISDERRAFLTRAAFVQGLQEDTELQHYIERHDKDKTSLQRAVSVAFRYERQHGVSKATSRFENVIGEEMEEFDAFQGQQAGRVWKKPYGTDWSKPAPPRQEAATAAPAEATGLAKLLHEVQEKMKEMTAGLTAVKSEISAIKSTGDTTKKVVEDDIASRKAHWKKVNANKKQNKFNAMEAKKAPAAPANKEKKDKKE